MNLATFDIVGIVFFAVIAVAIYRTAWFFSFYSFFKFLIIVAASSALGIIIAGANKYFLPVTNLQLSLIIQGMSFLILWKILSFKKLFFAATDSVIGINRFMFVHRIDRVLNVIPSLVASFFVTFFLFTMLVTASTNNPFLQQAIENSKIVKPAFYQIYFATLNTKGLELFNGVAFKLIPAVKFEIPGESSFHPPQNVPETTSPGGARTFIPPALPPTPIPETSIPFVPTRTIPPTVIPIPTSTPVVNINPFQNNQPPQIQPQPTSIPQPIQMPTNPISILQPQAVNVYQVEQDIFRMTNQQRAANGVSAFAWSDALAAVARAHSRDMAARHFFSHVNPDGLDPFQRMRMGGISYTTAGENIAGAATADIIVTNWMNSAGHRANILNPSFGHIGVGVAIDSTYGLLATQDFTN